MNILVTGGCGFIGSNFINFFHERYPTYNIINLDKIDYCSNVNNINKFAATNVKGNIHNKELLVHLIEKYNFDTVFHFAAQSHVDNSFIDPISFTMENTYGTHVLIDTFREFNKEANHYTWWSYFGNARTNNVGWRIDYFLISKTIRSILENAFILPKVTGSDHCPVGIILKK